MDDLLSIRDASLLLQRSTKSLRNYVKAGRLPAEKVPGPKGPQFVFRRSEVERLAAELRLDVAETLAHPASAAPVPGANLPANVPASLPALIEAFIEAERERVKLLEQVAEERAEHGKRVGTLEERVTQLTARLKREAQLADRSRDLERELRAMKKKLDAREEELSIVEAQREEALRGSWWQFWKPRA